MKETKDYKESLRKELKKLAIDLDVDWQCSGGLRHWNDHEMRVYIRKSAELAELVLEYLKEE